MISFCPSDFQRKAYGLLAWDPERQAAKFSWGEARWSRHARDDWRVDVVVNGRTYRGKSPKRPTPSELYAFAQGLEARGAVLEGWMVRG